MVDGTFRLPPGTAAALVAAVDATGMRTSTSPIVTTSATASVDHATAVASSHPSLAQQRADALIDLVTDGGASIETEIVLHVRGDGRPINTSSRRRHPASLSAGGPSAQRSA